MPNQARVTWQTIIIGKFNWETKTEISVAKRKNFTRFLGGDNNNFGIYFESFNKKCSSSKKGPIFFSQTLESNIPDCDLRNVLRCPRKIRCGDIDNIELTIGPEVTVYMSTALLQNDLWTSVDLCRGEDCHSSFVRRGGSEVRTI